MNYKNLIIGVLAVALLAYGAFNLFAPKLGIGEVTGWQSYAVNHFQQGFYVGTGRQLSIDNAGTLTTTGGATLGSLSLDSGTTINEFNCATTTYTTDQTFSSSSVATPLDITLSGAALGDIAIASVSSASSSGEWYVKAGITGAGTSTVTLNAVGGSTAWNDGLTIVSSTAVRTCYIGF